MTTQVAPLSGEANAASVTNKLQTLASILMLEVPPEDWHHPESEQEQGQDADDASKVSAERAGDNAPLAASISDGCSNDSPTGDAVANDDAAAAAAREASGAVGEDDDEMCNLSNASDTADAQATAGDVDDASETVDAQATVGDVDDGILGKGDDDDKHDNARGKHATPLHNFDEEMLQFEREYARLGISLEDDAVEVHKSQVSHAPNAGYAAVHDAYTELYNPVPLEMVQRMRDAMQMVPEGAVEGLTDCRAYLTQKQHYTLLDMLVTQYILNGRGILMRQMQGQEDEHSVDVSPPSS